MGAAFSPRSNLNRHIESVHEGKKSFKCNVYDTAFSEKSTLNGHIESVHDRKKPFQCNICDSCFSKNMNRHILNQFTKERTLSNVMCVIQPFL